MDDPYVTFSAKDLARLLTVLCANLGGVMESTKLVTDLTQWRIVKFAQILESSMLFGFFFVPSLSSIYVPIFVQCIHI